MIEHAKNFLARRKLREESRALTQQLVLGFGIGFILLVVGAYKYFISVGAWDALWLGAMWAGGFSIAMTLMMPFVWRGLEGLLRKFGNWLGHGVMTAILTIVYFLLIWPVGALLRASKGQHPIYHWDVKPHTGMEGWLDKKLPHDLPGSGRRDDGVSRRRTGMVSVLVFFARRGHIIFLPLLLLLVSLGIALFFLQTSALAPFIYTLF